jgi:hypothetical protein
MHKFAVQKLVGSHMLLMSSRQGAKNMEACNVVLMGVGVALLACNVFLDRWAANIASAIRRRHALRERRRAPQTCGG